MNKQINTPWGQSDHVKEFSNGIKFVTTPSHGGFFVPRPLYDAMPEELKCNVYGGGTWFEEDVEWSLVVIGFPHLFPKREVKIALDVISYYKDKDPYSTAAQWAEKNTEKLYSVYEDT